MRRQILVTQQALDEMANQLGEQIKLCGEAEVNFHMPVAHAYVLYAQLGLALRHPENDGVAAQVATEFRTYLLDAITDISPKLGEMIRWLDQWEVLRDGNEN